MESFVFDQPNLTNRPLPSKTRPLLCERQLQLLSDEFQRDQRTSHDLLLTERRTAHRADRFAGPDQGVRPWIVHHCSTVESIVTNNKPNPRLGWFLCVAPDDFYQCPYIEELTVPVACQHQNSQYLCMIEFTQTQRNIIHPDPLLETTNHLDSFGGFLPHRPTTADCRDS